ncbi:MAG: hypothetical protein WBE79_04615 [Candidatus Cybelea sp.]
MNTPLSGRLVLIVGAAALLSACGGSSVPVGGPSSAAAVDRAAMGAKTFRYTGREQTFLVPNGVRQISVVARGAAGGGEFFGRGGRVHGIIRVRPGEIVYVFVGGQGNGAAGGFNGGGNAGPGGTRGGASYGGGGASDVRAGSDTLRDRILVAAGGGGEGSSRFQVGGRGGGEIGGIGGSYCYRGSSCIGGGGGKGGTQSQGGAGGAGGFQSYQPGQPGTSGTFGIGGSGGSGGCSYYSGTCDCGYANGCPGAGGGGGYYGGGGGGGGAAEYASIYGGPGGAGGGGSSWAKSSVADFRTWAGWKNATGDGLVVFSW